jgi:hypothetical protein
MYHKLSIEAVTIDGRRFMDSSHELVLWTERNLVEEGGLFLESFDIDTAEVRRTKDRKFSWVSNLSIATSTWWLQ